MSTTCPCCHQSMPKPFAVSLDANSIATALGTLRLQPRRAELLHILSESFPRMVRTDELGTGLFGEKYWDFKPNTLKVHISRARSEIRQIGLDVEIVPRRGYRLTVSSKLGGGRLNMCCQRCFTRESTTAQLEAVYAYSAEHHDQICNGILDAVANSTIAHAGHRAAAERFFRHADPCVEAAPVEPLALPTRAWWTPWAEIAARNAAPVFMAACMLGGFLIGRLQ